MIRSGGLLAALGLVLALRAPAYAGTCKVGSFTKRTTTGTQVVAHGLGGLPKALILWTSGRTDETLSASYHFALGMSDGTTARSVAAASKGDGSPVNSDASRRIANKALSIVEWGQTVLAEADLQSWDGTNFTLSWTSNDGNAYVVHYLAISGNDVSAKVVGWTLNTTSGNQVVSTIGFKPDVVIHAHAGANFTSAPPTTMASSVFGLGVMDADGAQWANTHFTADNNVSANTQRYQRPDRALVVINAAASVVREATFVSMDANGYTVGLPNTGSAMQVVSLALQGVQAKAGSLLKVTGAAPLTQSVNGVLFRPRAVLVSSVQDTAEGAPAINSRFGLGVVDDTTQGSAAWTDTDAISPKVDAIDKTSKAFVKIDNNSSTIAAEANLTIDPAGFTLQWTTNDAVQTQLLYLMLAPSRRLMVGP